MVVLLVSELLLRYSHNIVEHLGLKLYQNKPTRVIAELVSNSWDADASTVSVNMSMDDDRWVAVLDNGHGMTRNELASNYLIIGLARRAHATEASRTGRPLMGRKGIGKLAPFGIAQTVDVVTSALVDDLPVVHWLRFDLKALLSEGSGEVSYHPTVLFEGGPLDSLPADKDATGQVEVWRQQIQSGKTGTLVLMKDLSLGRAISEGQLIDSLGTRFTVTLQGGFTVKVNDVVASTVNALPEFEFRIPEVGYTTEMVDAREVKSWVGFVKSASWPQDQAGVGVYSHGKIAQDRPFTFGVKGKEIFTRYMFGVVEADWLDEFGADLISTDRTSVNWDAAETGSLYEWGQAKVRSWVGSFEQWRQGQESAENRRLVKKAVKSGLAAGVTEPEEEEIVRLVSSITPSFGKDTQAKEDLINAVSDAWIQRPMRQLVRDLWDSVARDGGMPPEAFTRVVERLSSHSVPEALNLAVIFAQRAFALSRLFDYVHHGSEVDLQRLIERFPWIIEPDLAVLTANQALKTAIIKAEELGQIPTGNRFDVKGIPDNNRPDFVFLSSPEERQIVVVELKNPQVDLTITNRRQLEDYLTWFEAHYPDADRRGVLVGRKPVGMSAPYNNMTRLLQKSAILRVRPLR